jgi:DNA-binding GntR family transcriptional regulator
MANDNTEVAYQHIRNKILMGEYPLGSSLRTNRLATEIGVSRTPIRDALRLLETDGLVTIRPRFGARVVALDIDKFSQLCSMRLALETYAAGLAAANRTTEQLQEIKAAVEAMREAGQKASGGPGANSHIHEFQRQDLQFHIAILDAAKNPLIKNECTRIHLLDHVLSGKLLHSVAQSPNWITHVLAEHQALVDAIERGDIAGARVAMENHLQPVVDRCIAAMEHEASFREASFHRIQLFDTAVRSSR